MHYLIKVSIIILPDMNAKIGSGIVKSLTINVPPKMNQRGQQIMFHIVW